MFAAFTIAKIPGFASLGSLGHANDPPPLVKPPADAVDADRGCRRSGLASRPRVKAPLCDPGNLPVPWFAAPDRGSLPIAL